MCCKQIVFQAATEKGGHKLKAESTNVLCWFPTLRHTLSYLLITWRQGSCLFCVGGGQPEALVTYLGLSPIPVAERLRAWVCCRSLAGKNPSAGMVIGLSVLYCQVEDTAMGWSLVRRSPNECVVSECDREALTHLGLLRHEVTEEGESLRLRYVNSFYACLRML